MKTIRVLAILAVISLAAILIYRWQQKSSDENTVVIGAVLPLTGEVASYGTGSRDGIELAVEEANRSQSKLRFEVAYEDSKGDAKTAVTALQSLLTLKRPIAVIGENTSSANTGDAPRCHCGQSASHFAFCICSQSVWSQPLLLPSLSFGH